MPVTIAERKILRLAVLCVLYIAQGIPYGFVTVTLAGYVVKQGGGADTVGHLQAMATLPWAFKWAWGPIIDRFCTSVMGRRRPWIISAQAMMVLTAGALFLIPDLGSDLQLLGWMVLAHNIFASLQDVSVDALAVDLLPEDERGFANGLMYGSSYLGLMIGGAGFSTILGQHGLHAALLTNVLILTGIALVPVLLRERPGDKMLSLATRTRAAGSAGSMAEVARNLLKAFGRRSPLVAVLLALLIMLGAGALTAIGTALFIGKLGWTLEEFGQMAAGYPLLFGLGGSIAGGFVADRLGHKRVVAAASVVLGVTWIVFSQAEALWTDRTFIVVFICVAELCLGTMSAALFAMFMGIAWPKVAATQFTAFMALLNLSRTIGAKLAGTAGDLFGSGGSYLAFGILQIAVVLVLLPIDPKQNRRELGNGKSEPPS